MSFSQMIFAITGSSLHITFSLKNGFRPWVSWADVHSDWGRIGQFAKVLIPAQQWRYTYALWWTVPLTPITSKNMISSSFSFLKKGFANQDHKLGNLSSEKSATASTTSSFSSSGTYPATPTRAFAFPITLNPLPAAAGSDDTVLNITKDGNALLRGERANAKDMDAVSLSEFAFSATPSSSLPSYTQSPLALSLSSRASFASASSSRPSPTSTSSSTSSTPSSPSTSTSPSTRFSTHSSSYEVDLEAYPLPPTPTTPFTPSTPSTPSTIHSVPTSTAHYTHRESTSSTHPSVYPFVAI
ncbi:hypothetical protein EYR40_010030 [Pleurotus pulmonarius]|nr:hypothetical protein EYR36_010573 [Pleurotus pulmonarius]KAF4588479.1 hypothetical protein EYR40_010030 [Pleurotus pulmonarius]